jgi:hypothetical protein
VKSHDLGSLDRHSAKIATLRGDRKTGLPR